MKSRFSKPLLIVTPFLGLGAALALTDKAASPLLVEYAAYDLVRPHTCTELVLFPSRRILAKRKELSVVVLRRRLAQPGQNVRAKMILADQLCQLGDTTSFQVLIDALSSTKQRHRLTAAWLMQGYPALCAQHLPAILKAGQVQQSGPYRDLLFMIAGKIHLPDDKKDVLMEKVLDIDWQNKGATAKEIAQLQHQFS